MANKDTRNNVSGAPKTTGNYAKATGGQNTGAFVRSASGSSNAPGDGDFVHGGLGNQNDGYGDGPKRALKMSPEVSLENNKDGGAVQGQVSAVAGDKRTRVAGNK